MTTPEALVNALMTEADSNYFLESVSYYKTDTHFTMLEKETDRLPDGSFEFFWFVNTYSLNSEGYITDVINNTGSIDNYPEALQNYGWHLDLYYSKTLEEVMK